MGSRPEATDELDPAVASVLKAHEPWLPPWKSMGIVAFLRRRWLALLAGALTAVLLFTPLYLLNYQPIMPAGRLWGGSPRGCVELSDGLSAPRSGEQFRVVTIECPGGTQVRWSEAITNDGPLAITITDIPAPEMYSLHEAEVRLAEGPATRDWIDALGPEAYTDPNRWESLMPFEPFVLSPGEYQEVVYQATIAEDCFDESTWRTRYHMKYSVFGVPRGDSVPHYVVPTIICPSSV